MKLFWSCLFIGSKGHTYSGETLLRGKEIIQKTLLAGDCEKALNFIHIKND